VNILFLNWRDTSHPGAGGAEKFTEEIGRRLASYGHSVTIFTSRFEGSEPETQRLGMRIVREGGRYTVYFKARNFVRQHLSKFDIIVDEINTVPFQIAGIAKTKPVVALIHQLAREIWFHETRFPFNALGYFALEPYWLRKYRQIPTITVSESTKGDLLARGFEQVHVVHNGTPASIGPTGKKEDHPVMIYLGRLVRSKLPGDAIKAFRRVRSSIPDAELWMVGDGYLRHKLEKQAPERVTFYGRVDENAKFGLLRRAHVLISPSVREGWGISVLEANSQGTPAVGYDVPGLRDSIVDNATGLLVPPSDYEALSKALEGLLSDSNTWQKLSSNAVEWSRKFSWEDSALEFQEILKSVSNGF